MTKQNHAQLTVGEDCSKQLGQLVGIVIFEIWVKERQFLPDEVILNFFKNVVGFVIVQVEGAAIKPGVLAELLDCYLIDRLVL